MTKKSQVPTELKAHGLGVNDRVDVTWTGHAAEAVSEEIRRRYYLANATRTHRTVRGQIVKVTRRGYHVDFLSAGPLEFETAAGRVKVFDDAYKAVRCIIRVDFRDLRDGHAQIALARPFQGA